MSKGMWAMMTLLEVFDCSFSDSLVHKFSAPEKKEKRKQMQPEQIETINIPMIMTSEHAALLTLCYNWLPCSSLTAHTMRSTQAALAWQRSLRGLCSPSNPPVSWSTRCSSDWLLLNCSSTKSCTSRTNAGCKAEKHGEGIKICIIQSTTIIADKLTHFLWCFTFHVVQCVPQHFEHTHIERVAEGFVTEVDSRIRLNKTEETMTEKII